MITLTTPPQINSVLGGNTPVGYDKFALSRIVFNPVLMTLEANIRLTSTTQPDMQEIIGSLSVNTATALLKIEVPQLDFYRRVTLTGPQNTAVQTQIRDAQDALEAGLVSLGVASGTQQTGV